MEVEILQSLTTQLVELVNVPSSAAEPADPFEMWERDLAADPDAPEQPDDPVMRRLFPDAYPHDAAASSDFRRYTERDLRDRKVRDAGVVLAGLAATRDGTQDLVISDDETGPWLRTLTALRLSISVRLGITDEESAAELHEISDEDPRAFMYSVLGWLGFAQETLLEAMNG